MSQLRAFVSKPALRLAGAVAMAGLLALSAPVQAQVDTLKVMIGANQGGVFDQSGRTVGAPRIGAGSPRNCH